MNKKSHLIFIILLLFSALKLQAQTTILNVGHLINTASETVTDSQLITVRFGKILNVGSELDTIETDTIIDLSDYWVMPGLFDVHTHITFNGPPNENLAKHWEVTYLVESTAYRALRGVHNARNMLEAGFTTIKDIGNEANYAMTDVRKAIERGWFVGPTVFSAGKIIAPFGGQSHGIVPEAGLHWLHEYIDADTPDEIRKAVRENIYYGANVIKLVADNSVYYYSEEEIRAAVEEAHKAGVKVTVHVDGGEAAKNVILGGADAIEHGFKLDDDLLKMMEERGTVLVGTDFGPEHLKAMGMPETMATRYSDGILDRLKRAHKIGVKMAFGRLILLICGKRRKYHRQRY
jgi:imidazolonepropionase-like amidohydrolase